VIHATHLDAAEITRLAASGATVGLCPITEANLGDGVFSAAEFLAAGGRFGIGTDSNVDIGVAGELRMLEYAQRLTHRARNVMVTRPGDSTGRSLYDMAVAGGNAALKSGPVGLAAGAPADIVCLATPVQELSSRESGDTLMDRLIFAGRAAPAIDSVWVNGQRVVSSGRHHRRSEIFKAFHATLRRALSN
jgi:cytosine/adenosine deaminase-related metal-dependent hydrolase